MLMLVNNIVQEMSKRVTNTISFLYIEGHEGPKFGPRIEGSHSAGGSSQVHEGPHRDHGHVLHKVRLWYNQKAGVNCSY